MAVSWYPDTVVGTLGHLAGSIDDGLGLSTHPVFAKAASAIVKAGLLAELHNPVAKEAIAFVEASKGQPWAFTPTCEAALQARMGTCSRI